MQKHMKTRLAKVVVLVGLFATGLFGVRTAAAQPTEQGSDLLGIVQQFVTAWNAGDTATLGNILDPSYQAVITNMPPNAPPPATQPTNRAAELQNAGQRLVHVTASSCSQASSSTVKCDITLSGGPTANLPHPYTETAVFTISNGKIVRNDETLSDITRNDFAQIFSQLQQQPGMPTTGRPDGATGSGLLYFLLACGGLLFAAGGAFVRRRGDSRY